MPANSSDPNPSRLYYRWWIVFAAFLNLFFAVGIVYYGFPVFYPFLIESMGITRAETTQGFFVGFVVVAPLFGLLAGAMIDRFGARHIILIGVGFIGLSLVFMGGMTAVWQYYLLCFAEVIGYVLAGPISNQVLIASWFRRRRGQAMGYAYLGLGLGGAVSPLLIHWLIENFGWRRAFEIIGIVLLVVLVPIGIGVTRSSPGEVGLLLDGIPCESETDVNSSTPALALSQAVRAGDFWLLLVGSSLTIGTIGSVVQHLILFLKDQGYSSGWASHALSMVLIASLAGRVVVGYFADRFAKRNVMALFYLLLALAIPLLFLARQAWAVYVFSILFGFAMGADYMLIPLVAAECFGLAALGRLLALIIMADSLAQTFGPVLAGMIFDKYRSYDLAWVIVIGAGILGAGIIYLISPQSRSGENLG